MKIMIAHRLATAAAAMVVCASPAMAETTLLGDTLSFLRAYPDTSTQYLGAIPDTVVALGPADQVSWIANDIVYTTFDPEPLKIDITSHNLTGYGDGNRFDGYVISGFSHDIQSLSLTNGTGFNITLSLLDPRTLAIDLAGLSSGTFSVGIGLTPPVPEPASLGLLAAGLGVLAIAARRRAKPPAC